LSCFAKHNSRLAGGDIVRTQMDPIGTDRDSYVGARVDQQPGASGQGFGCRSANSLQRLTRERHEIARRKIFFAKLNHVHTASRRGRNSIQQPGALLSVRTRKPGTIGNVTEEQGAKPSTPPSARAKDVPATSNNASPY